MGDKQDKIMKKKFKQGVIVCSISEKHRLYVMSTNPDGRSNGTFQGVVIHMGNQDYYKTGEHSTSWHYDKFTETDHIDINL